MSIIENGKPMLLVELGDVDLQKIARQTGGTYEEIPRNTNHADDKALAPSAKKLVIYKAGSFEIDTNPVLPPDEAGKTIVIFDGKKTFLPYQSPNISIEETEITLTEDRATLRIPAKPTDIIMTFSKEQSNPNPPVDRKTKNL